MTSNYEKSAQQQELIRVYEFSKGFDNPHYSEKYQRWVSGGFSEEIASSNRPVPEKIQSHVKRGYFRINDNYPPDIDKKDIALIAREIDEYSILAVATGEYDDKGLRHLVAYRYFWLQKTDKDIDGIATLLNWWLSQDRPCFQFSNYLSSNYNPSEKINDMATIYTLDDSRQKLHQNFAKLSNLISKITVYPYTCSHKIDEPTTLHLVTFNLCQTYNVPLAWAWNVTWLEKSASTNLTLIHCVDDKTCQNISIDVKKYLKKIQCPIESNVKIPPLGNFNTEITSPETEMTPTILQTEKDTNDIKQNLISVADTQNISDILKLLNFMEKFSIKSWEWGKIINTRKFEEITEATARYWALSVMLGYKSAAEWLEWLEQNCKYKTITFVFQQRLLNISTQSKNPQIPQQFSYQLFQSISKLLLDYTSQTGTYKQNIEQLLLRSKSIWSRGCTTYGKNIFYQLARGEENAAEDKFYQKLLLARNEWEERNTINPSLIGIAELFRQVNNYDLSALLYQLSKGCVPSEIYKQVIQVIIPLTKDSTEPDKRSWRFLLYQLNKIPVWTPIAGGLLVLLLIPWILISQKPATNNQPNWIISSSLEGEMTRWERAETPQGKSDSVKDINERIREFQLELNGNPGNNKSPKYDRTYSFIKELLLPEIKLTSQNLKRHPIKVGSDPDDIKVVQHILQTLENSGVEINGNFDGNTQEAVKKFQENRRIQAVGHVGRDTWNAMLYELTKKQLQKTVEFLRINFQTQDDTQVKENIRSLQDCKKDALKYLECVQNLSDKIQPPTPTPTP